jgi:hypothetical protein
MRHASSLTHFACLALASACVPTCSATDDLSALIVRLANGESSQSILFKLEAQPPDPRTIPALKSAFEHRTTREEKQWIAATLIRLGESSPIYFDYLANIATEAVDDRAPFFLKYDNAGNPVRGEFDIGFLNWCAQNGKDPRAIGKIQFGSYISDVRILAYAQDPRGAQLLMRGLESPNPLVVGYSVEGLGRLHDAEAFPLIEKSLERGRSGDIVAIAQQLCWFRTPDAEKLFEQFVPDSHMRDFARRQVQMLQLSEENRALQRAGKPVQQR